MRFGYNGARTRGAGSDQQRTELAVINMTPDSVYAEYMPPKHSNDAMEKLVPHEPKSRSFGTG